MSANLDAEVRPAKSSPSLDPDSTWPGVPDGPPPRLVLTWGAHERQVTENQPLLTVGREECSGIVIKNDKISRLHAMIKFSGLGFTLTDRSSNGTYVVDDAGTTWVVHNDTHKLTGTGTISFGIDPATDRPQLVRYAVRDRTAAWA
jgi:pSer/pThr/pTyr-binding forkhead associated (FHA) protein